jgi:hypothetical protein
MESDGMKTIDEIAAELVKRGRYAESEALTMIRLLDYDADLRINAEAYRAAVRTILDAMDRAREQLLANMRAALVSIDSDEWDEYASPVPMPGTIG